MFNSLIYIGSLCMKNKSLKTSYSVNYIEYNSAIFLLNSSVMQT